ncbi:DHH family phosphoesterase [Anaeromassilibacillus senegalensis]|uniref:Bifunctional oligoribonuclease/PAP phosphatase NrnA n=1 Tax=Anaeromassilibacillus senegalensis TaxID=1673717 RepID=A0ABS9CNK3_9FIRM|nr:bifunctional oligoribonuclease/PAP phosphatase NrnA [Anaeromassilibacillus senegalensis]MCF2652732.1 bifunctional oligoribonuclease/PAP phosphatase NrnA [Anaeromassilibacillus senegalensis]
MADMKRAADLLQSWDRILILSHRSPDGDTLGCASALSRALLALGKSVQFRCADPVPKNMAYLFAGIEYGDFEPERIVTVDVADKALLGALEPLGERVDLAIDHHGTHRPFAREIWVDDTAGAACQMIYKLVQVMGVEITPEIADCLYTGISTDTGCFRYSNASPETHRIAASLLECGARAAEINRAMFETKSRAAVELLKHVYGDMEFYHDGRCAVLCLTRALLEETGAGESELTGVSSFVRQVEGVLIGLTLQERGENEYKVSMRSNAPASAQAVCARFGGGGHKFAAGCTIHAPLEEAKAQIVAACGEALKAF